MKTNEQKAAAFSTASVVLSLIAYVLYNWQTIIGNAKPNISAWAVWSFLTVLNSISYRILSGKWLTSVLPTANAMMTLVTLVVVLRTGSLKNLTVFSWVCLVLGAVAGIFWLLCKVKLIKLGKPERAPVVVQVLLQIAIVVGFLPLLWTAWNTPEKEVWLPWFLWTMSFMAQGKAVHLKDKKEGIEYLYPFNMIFFHGIVFLLVLNWHRLPGFIFVLVAFMVLASAVGEFVIRRMCKNNPDKWDFSDYVTKLRWLQYKALGNTFALLAFAQVISDPRFLALIPKIAP